MKRKRSVTPELPTLPSWLRAELPEQRPQLTLYYDDEGFKVSGDNKVYGTVEEAYDAHHNDNLKASQTINGHGGNLERGMFFCDSRRLLIFVTDMMHQEMLAETYQEWLELDAEWGTQHKDFSYVYRWLNNHPMFWTKPENPKMSWFWNTDFATSSFTVDVYRWKGKLHVRVEAGEHVAPEYTYHYFDPRLTGTGRTMEQAYRKLADNIRKYYNPDGTEKHSKNR